MKKKKSFKKFLVLVAIAGGIFVCGATSIFFAKYNSDFFSNILLSLTITPSSVVPDDEEIEHVGNGNGSMIFHVKVPVQPVDSSVDAGGDSNQVVSEFIDEVNGISVVKQSENLVVSVPVLPAMEIGEVIIPESPSEDTDIENSNSDISFSGVVEPYSYILLEVSSQPNIVTLFTNENGEWSYDLPYSLAEGLHHAYVWSFSQTDGVKTLISSKAFMVSAVSGKRTELFMENGMLKAAVSNSSLVSSLRNQDVGGQLLYVNGRVLNDLEALSKMDELRFIVFVKPLFGEFKDVDFVNLNFNYKIYNEEGGLIDSVSDGDLNGDSKGRRFENGVLSFTKSFVFTSSDKIKIGKYKVMVEVDSEGFSYWLPLNFEVVEKGAVGGFDKYGTVLLLSLALLILVVGSLYAGQFIPRSPHRKGK